LHLSRWFLAAPAPAHASTLSLHDALPISTRQLAVDAVEALQVLLDPARAVGAPAGDAAPEDGLRVVRPGAILPAQQPVAAPGLVDRKSTRLNSSHVKISYAVFCLKKKTKQ